MRETEHERAERLSVLGAYVGRKRTEAGLSLRQLADVTGISKSMLNAIENGKAEPSDEAIEALAGPAIACLEDCLYYLCRRLPPDLYTPHVTDRDAEGIFAELRGIIQRGERLHRVAMGGKHDTA